MKNYSEEIKELIEKYMSKGFEYGKPMDFLLPRIKASKEEVENEIINCKDLRFIEKQKREGETRYVLYFVYSRSKGRVYVITFTDKIIIITAYPLGKKTLKKYHKGRFKK